MFDKLAALFAVGAMILTISLHVSNLLRKRFDSDRMMGNSLASISAIFALYNCWDLLSPPFHDTYQGISLAVGLSCFFYFFSVMYGVRGFKTGNNKGWLSSLILIFASAYLIGSTVFHQTFQRSPEESSLYLYLAAYAIAVNFYAYEFFRTKSFIVE